MKRAAAEPYRDIDFSGAKRGPVVPLEPGKTKISIRLDNAVLEYFRALVDKGNSVVVIEHNMDVLKNADHIIDMGPEGGGGGGEIIAEGIPKEIAAHKKSHTGAWLKRVLA